VHLHLGFILTEIYCIPSTCIHFIDTGSVTLIRFANGFTIPFTLFGLGQIHIDAFNHFALLAVERRCPDHHIVVRSPGNHLVAQGTEVSRGGRALVAVEGVHDVAAEQVPDLERAVVARAQQLVAAWVHRDARDRV